MDGSHEWTQRAIFSQQNFPEVVKDCISDVMIMAHFEEDIVCFRGCHTGYHRCDVECRVEKEALNRIEVMVEGRPFRLIVAI